MIARSAAALLSLRFGCCPTLRFGRELRLRRSARCRLRRESGLRRDFASALAAATASATALAPVLAEGAAYRGAPRTDRDRTSGCSRTPAGTIPRARAPFAVGAAPCAAPPPSRAPRRCRLVEGRERAPLLRVDRALVEEAIDELVLRLVRGTEQVQLRRCTLREQLTEDPQRNERRHRIGRVEDLGGGRRRHELGIVVSQVGEVRRRRVVTCRPSGAGYARWPPLWLDVRARGLRKTPRTLQTFFRARRHGPFGPSDSSSQHAIAV